MKKQLLILLLSLTVSILISSISMALDRTFSITATVPAATGVVIDASRVDSDSGTFTTVAGNDLNFNTGAFLPFDSENGIFIPDHFFAIDVGVTGGAGTPTVNVTYTEGAKPVSQVNGLGTKATATFVKVTGAIGDQTETGIATHGPKKMLKDVADNVTPAEQAGGFLRIYVGIVTKDPDATFPDPAASEPFTTSDQPGSYTGTLLVSGTLP